MCQDKLQEMSGLVTKFITRRTNDPLRKYCATRLILVVFAHR